METAKGKNTRRRAVRALQAAAVAALLWLAPAFAEPPAPNALPTGGQVVAGQAAISRSGNQLTINQATPRSILNWQTFDIGQDAAVRFNQPDAASATLNRILSLEPSRVHGSLTANGQVFFLNPGGVIFGKTARVNVGSLGVSTLGLRNSDFLAGRYFFEKAIKAGPIVNEGKIQAADGGYVAFISPRIENSGEITADRGVVALAAGDKVSLDFRGDKLINFTIHKGAVEALIENRELIRAGEGTVYLSARAADSLSTAVVNSSGIIEARGIREKGGRIILEGDAIMLASPAKADVSGSQGGGEVLIGGAARGAGDLLHARSVVLAQGAIIDASATDKGEGGKVVLWSDGLTQVDGTILAQGGPKGGEGGFVETSGHTLNIGPGARVNTLAPFGTPGMWLLDPYDITVAASGGNVTGATLAAALNTSNVTLDTSLAQYQVGSTNTDYSTAPSSGSGDITVSDAVAKTGSGTTTLTLKANRNISIGNAVSSNSGPLNVVLWADADADADGTDSGGGFIALSNPSSITTNGGHLWLGGGSGSTTWNGLTVGNGYAVGNSLNANGIWLQGATIATGGGNIAMFGKSRAGLAAGGDSGVNVEGIRLARDFNVSINSGSGNIYLEGISRGAGTWNSGVEFDGSMGAAHTVTSAAPAGNAITVVGDGSAVETGASSTGVWLHPNAVIRATGGGGISISGTGGNTGSYNDAIWINNASGSNTVIDAGTGELTLVGRKNAINVPYAVLKGGATSLIAEAADHAARYAITATNAGNDFTGPVSVVSGAAAIKDANALSIGAADMAGDLTVEALGGNVTAGNISKTSGAVSTLSLKATGDVTLASEKSISGASGSPLNILLNSDTDINGGRVIVQSGTTIASFGGDIVMGGGSCTAAGCTAPALSTAVAGPLGAGGEGVAIGAQGGSVTSLNSSGGHIWLWGKGTAKGGAGVTLLRTEMDSGAAGSIWMRGDGQYTTSMNGHGIVVADSSTVRGGSGGVTISGNANTNASASAQYSYSLALGFGGDTPTSTRIYTTDGGTLSINLDATLGNGNKSNWYFGEAAGSLGHDTLQNGDINITFSGTDNLTPALPAVNIPAGNLNVTSHRGISNWAASCPWGGGACDYGRTQTVAGTTTISGGGFDVKLGGVPNNGTTGFRTGRLAVSNTQNLSVLNNGALELGGLETNVTGAIDIATADGDLTVSGNIATGNATASAIKLTAEKNRAAGDGTGGNIIISGTPTLGTGAGGSAVLYTGSVVGSTGLTDLLGAGSGRFRYNSDESATNYTTALAAGAYAIYREQPTLTITADSKTGTYGTAPALTTTVSGQQNGDTAEQAIGAPATVTVGGSKSSSDNYTAGSHPLTPSGAVSGLGYGLSYTDGTLTVSEKELTGSIAAAGKVYDGNDLATITARTLSGTIAGDDVSYAGGTATFSDKDAAQGKTVSGTGLGLAGADAANYAVNASAVTTADIAKRALTIKADDASKVYGDADPTPTATYTGLVSGETAGVVSGLTLTAPTGANATGRAHAIIAAGGTAANYEIAWQDGTLTVAKAQLTVTADDQTRPQGSANPPLTATYAGFKYSDTEAQISTKPVASTTAGPGSPPGKYPITLSGGFAQNYAFNYVGGTMTVQPAAVDVGTIAKINVQTGTTPAAIGAPSPSLLSVSGELAAPPRHEELSVALLPATEAVHLPAEPAPPPAPEAPSAPKEAAQVTAPPSPATEEAPSAPSVAEPPSQEVPAPPLEAAAPLPTEISVPPLSAAAPPSPEISALPAAAEPPPSPAIAAPPPEAAPPPVVPKSKGYVVLLENEDGTVGAITVTNARGTQLIDKKGYGLALTSENEPLGEPQMVSEETIKADFGHTLSVTPDPPLDFRLYFALGKAFLTGESERKIAEIASAVKKRTVSRIGIVGHTDSSGNSKTNYQLGLSRARYVQKKLLAAGVKAEDIIDVASHGESNPLVVTAKGVREPRNRRVEVTIW